MNHPQPLGLRQIVVVLSLVCQLTLRHQCIA